MDTLFKDNSWFEGSYHFNINTDLDATAMKPIRAVVERPELWKVFINGNEVAKTEGKYRIEKSFPEFAVGEFLKPGINTVTIKALRIHILAEVIPIYLLGEFSVIPKEKGFEIAGGNFDSLGNNTENPTVINTPGAIFGNGFHNINRERYRKIVIAYGMPKMICKLQIEYTDGTNENVISDNSWKTSPSPITYSSIYGGEDYDARLEQQNWNKPEFDESSWKNVQLVTPPACTLTAETNYPLKVMDTFDDPMSFGFAK